MNWQCNGCGSTVKDACICGVEFIFKLEDESDDKIRAHKLNDGDVFTVKELTVQFENKLLHEVKFCGYDEYMQSIWNKTGNVFTAEELNKLCK